MQYRKQNTTRHLFRLASRLHERSLETRARSTASQPRSCMVVRQHPRFPAAFSGTLGHQNRLHRITKSLDLSRKGCRIQCSLRAIAGMKVDLLLYVPEDETPILIEHAVVRWCGTQGIGIEFQSLTPSHQERLDRTLRRLETKVGHA